MGGPLIGINFDYENQLRIESTIIQHDNIINGNETHNRYLYAGIDEESLKLIIIMYV